MSSSSKNRKDKKKVSTIGPDGTETGKYLIMADQKWTEYNQLVLGKEPSKKVIKKPEAI
jgi:hypothetical protein